MKQHLQFIENLVRKGGPDWFEYDSFNKWIETLTNEYQRELISREQLLIIRDSFGEALTPATMQGLGRTKRFGYHGDFEIIDRIYISHLSPEPHLENWDLYFQQHAAPIAVRNRKAYFMELLHRRGRELEGKDFNVLNVASGPARDLYEYFQTDSPKPKVECIEHDPMAIKFAENLCRDFLAHIKFHQANVFKFKTEKKYELIWSAGLFDYFNDNQFRFLLKRLLTFLAPDGELVIGNFSKNNPSRSYMEILSDWVLTYRSAEDLIRLAQDCGASEESIFVGQEPLGVNLFLHISNSAESDL